MLNGENLTKILCMFYTKYLYNQNWNIGFTGDTVDSFFKFQALSKVKWMKHSYRDRYFADPFILKVTDEVIVLLAEEYVFNERKGRILKLVVDKATKQLLERIVILELDTHLSYPAIFREGDSIYIYPENLASGKINIYRYEDETSKVTFVKTLIKQPLADSTIIDYKDRFWLVATKAPDTQENACLYVSDSFDGEYAMVGNAPIASDRGFARPAGSFIKYEDTLYRPAQDCTYGYGKGIVIQKVDFISDSSYSERTLFKIYPHSFKYNLGLHTINFYDGECVIDGYGYLYPVMGRLLKLLRIIKHKLVNGRS